MSSYEAYESGVEVKGATVESLINGAADLSSVFEKRMRDALADNGIEDVDGDEWYRLQSYLDTFERVRDDIGSQTLANVGKKIPDNAEWPPEIDTVGAGLNSIDDAYQMNHRGGDIGRYECEVVGDGEAVITCANPYPCEFDRGLVAGVAERFSSPGTFVEVEEESDVCREDGGEQCVYRVSWS